MTEPSCAAPASTHGSPAVHPSPLPAVAPHPEARSPAPLTEWQCDLVRVAFVGKGGAGKSAIAGTFCRLLARASGRGVVAIDSDPLPGLAVSLGVRSDDAMLPADLVEKVGVDPDSTWQLRTGLTVLDAVEQYAVEGPDGVRFLQFGKLRGHVRAAGPSQQAFRVIVRELTETDLHLVGDLPGGTRQAFFGWAGFAEAIVVVAEATPSSMLSARRLARLAGTAGTAGNADGGPLVVAVANKTVGPDDAVRLGRFSGLRVIGAVPHDPSVGAAERTGTSLLDAAPASPAVAAIGSLVEALVREAP